MSNIYEIRLNKHQQLMETEQKIIIKVHKCLTAMEYN